MKRTITIFLGLLAVGEVASAQGLADAARREKERRAKAGQGEAAAKVVTDDELKSNHGKLANDPSVPPANVLGPPDQTTSRRVAIPTSSGSAGSGSPASSASTPTNPPIGGSEGAWRSGIRTLHENIARLEKEVATLNAKADKLSYGVATSKAPPMINGQPVWVETPGARQSREGSNASDQMAWQKERADVLDRLERAKGSLAKARADLATFEESARRQNIPPGWLRD